MRPARFKAVMMHSGVAPGAAHSALSAQIRLLVRIEAGGILNGLLGAINALLNGILSLLGSLVGLKTTVTVVPPPGRDRTPQG